LSLARPIAAAGRYHPARTPVESEAAAPSDYRPWRVGAPALRPNAARLLIDLYQVDLTEARHLVGRALKRRERGVPDPEKLRELASWYREFAEHTDNPAIWDARLRTAEDLEAEAARLETAAAARAKAA
jgi:hypothetical protein